MWKKGWREEIWGQLRQNWDLIIIGGGITGAGIFRMASNAGVKTLLIEANDFAFGTSSRSSKLVHGGLRYIKNGQYDVTFESVRERERLLKEAPFLVTPLEFIFPVYERYHATPRQVGFSLNLYDAFAFKRAHGKLTRDELGKKAPTLYKKGLSVSFYYFDAAVDDARLVLRNLQEGVSLGGTAINYVKAQELLFDNSGGVCGVVIADNDQSSKTRSLEVTAKVVVNATGPWTDDIRANITDQKIIRKLRGSHIQFTYDRFPISCAFSITHPIDKRSMFVLPWEGVTLVGTTDLEHPVELEQKQPEPFITKAEEEYLLMAVNHYFPEYALTSKDIITSFSGLRPIISSSGEVDPSKESRAHSLLYENGLITITGGKLTTYRKMAFEAMQKVQKSLNRKINLKAKSPVLNQILYSQDLKGYTTEAINRWSGRFGDALPLFLESIYPDEDELINNTTAHWSELRWATRNEGVIHLDDLLLRRVRLGLLLPEGGLQHKEKIKTIVQQELGWNQARWQQELKRYQILWKNCYYLPI